MMAASSGGAPSQADPLLPRNGSQGGCESGPVTSMRGGIPGGATLRQTPLYDEHLALGGKIVDFHGWALPVQFAGIIEEHHHTRKLASLFDCSHMGEFLIIGQDAIEAFSAIICSDPVRLPVGRAKYGAMLLESGGIVDDLITMKLAEDRLFVVTNAGPLAEVSRRIRACHTQARDISDETAKIDIQGPLARDLLANEIPEAAALKYFQVREVTWQGMPIVLSRTGYTGELGYEIFVPNELAVPLWRKLLSYAPVRPAGLGARDTLRTEVCYALSGQDFDSTRTPLEANMAAYIAWDTDFIGKAALEAQRAAGNYPILTPIRAADRRAPRHGFDVKLDGRVVGTITSGTFGPSVGHGVGLAYLPRNLTQPGTLLTAGPKDLPIETARAPLYSAGTCRA